MPDNLGTSAGPTISDSSRTYLSGRSPQRTDAPVVSPYMDGMSQYSQAAANFAQYAGPDASKYDFNYRSFPDDLGSNYNSHYMVININVQTDAMNNPRGGQGFDSSFGPANYTMRGDLSTIDSLKFPNGINSLPGTNLVAGGSDNATTIQLQRSTRRIKEAIALFMPVPTIYTHTNVYEEISLTAFGAQALKLGVTAAGKAIAAGLSRTADAAVRNGLGVTGVINSAFNNARKIASIAGYPINPKIEVLFSHTPQRSFRMEILMAPKNAAESETIKNIISTLRFHSAPEISSFGAIFPVFIPPAEFDIKFYHNGRENLNIPRINTCAMEQIEVDYAPTGVYSTFRNGHPVAIRLSMAFRELEILHKQRVTQGF